ncbi:hypothetical protein SAMN05444339_101294 [Loktanella atrilutea]|uniref:DUF2087 domain-containing protein n=2 Tax=Loktanella atrilutea TaxID=366533 RepID=A0A1M4T8M7_LOKAT|nr:hypothetical protein SAMN05444339_101294 [Loktanella atrilutea]
MSHSPIPLVIDDLSQFATHLRGHWPTPPVTQSAALALIAQAAGYRNHQHLRARTAPLPDLDKQALNRVKAALAVFDEQARMTRWPLKTSVQRLCVAWFWTRLPTRTDLTEKQVNAILRDNEVFGDHVLLRRCLIENGLATRTADGATYRRVGRSPDAEERAVIRALSARAVTRP